MCGMGKEAKVKNIFNSFMLSSKFRRQIGEVIANHFLTSRQFHKDMPIYACFGTQVFAIEILQSLPKWVEATAVGVNGLLSLITDVRLEELEEFREWIDQTIGMLSREELYGLSLYLWFVLDTQIPYAEFIANAKNTQNLNKNKTKKISEQQTKNKKSANTTDSNNRQQKPQTGKKSKKQKKKQVVLFRIGL